MVFPREKENVPISGLGDKFVIYIQGEELETWEIKGIDDAEYSK